MFCKKLTEPQLPVWSIIHASSVTFPSRSGQPPYPTLWQFGSASETLTPSSTALIALPLFFIISYAFSLASNPCFHVEITIGKLLIVFLFLVLQEYKLDPIMAPATPIEVFLIKPLRLDMFFV